MIDPENFRDMFKRDPKVDARILNSVMPSDFFPARGQYFRVRAATIADRSFMGDIWLCVESQDYCAVGRKVLDTYSGMESRDLGNLRSFVFGDVIFYNCTAIWDAVRDLEDIGKTPPAPAADSDTVETATT